MCFTTTVVFAGKDDPDESPTVTSPKGGESWKTGTTRVIKWSKGSGFNFVKIQLLKSGKHYKWVSKKTKNDGKHPWKIPATVATSSAYKVKVTATTDNKLTDTSNKNFTITKTGGGGSSLSLTTPNGGQKWTTGKKYAIKWSKGNGGAHVKIQLLKSSKHSIWISKKTKNDGRYTWMIPDSVSTSTAYKIRITSTSKSTVKDVSSKTFTITESNKLKVIWPKGGECLETGRYYTFRWNRTGISTCCCHLCTVHVEFYNGPSVTYYARNTGKYKWYISEYECAIGGCGTYYVEIYNSYSTKYPKEYARSKGKVTIAEKCN